MVESAEGVGELLEELKNNTFKKYDAFTVGEVFNMKPEELPEFIGENGHFSTIFDFCAQCLSDGEHGWYDAPKIDFDKWRKSILGSQLETESMHKILPESRCWELSAYCFEAFRLYTRDRKSVCKMQNGTV